ncbi:hypothetical protein VYU27_010568, partial [Nannochloropsis oceanica]
SLPPQDTGDETLLTPFTDAGVYGRPQFIFRYSQDTPPTDPAEDATSLHQDVYQVLLYAVEHSTASTNDREKIAKLWRDFFKMFFSLPDKVLEGSPADDKAPPPVAGEPPSGPSLPKGEESILGTQTLYVMMRLHHLLYQRLQTAREICEATAREICEAARTSKEVSAAHPLKAMRADDPGETAEGAVLAKHVEGGYKGFKAILL